MGTLNIVTAKPNFEIQGGSLTLNAGRYNEAGTSSLQSSVTDNLALRFAYAENRKDSYLTGYYSGSQLDWRAASDIRDQFQTISSQSENILG